MKFPAFPSIKLPTLQGLASHVPIIRTLGVCTREAKRKARTELSWNISFALIPLGVVALIVVMSQPLPQGFGQIFSVIGRGELMVYAASICGAALYSLRHAFDGPIPEVIKDDVTPVGTLQTVVWICVSLAMAGYIIRKASDLHSFPLNVWVVNWSSAILLALAILVAYVTFSLKYALASGATVVSREQTVDFGKTWERERDA